MECKLIFLDIDGTLTEPGKNVPPASAVEAVRKARDNGHKVVLWDALPAAALRL